MKRRQFLSGTAAIAALSGIPLLSLPNGTHAPGQVRKLKIAMVGTGVRGIYCWGKPVVEAYGDRVELAGLCDVNPKRLAVAKKIIGTEARLYAAADFDRMIRELQPDLVIVTVPDCFHENYIVRALEQGCDVLSEKPIATEASQCQRIADTENRTGKRVYVGFNVRYMNESTEMKKILMSGELGNILSIDFQECLNTLHGADYYRRWHRLRAYSGTLLLQKASHHFDLINWLLEADPVEVQAMGKLAFYGKNNPFRSTHCRDCAYTGQCKFYWDIRGDETAMALYASCEEADGYLRDGCVWRNDIDIYDTSTVHVSYDNGTLLTYSMNTFLPFEGQYICFSGEKGRLEVRINNQQPWAVGGELEFRLTTDRETTRSWVLNTDTGGHGGADERLKDSLFLPASPDILKQRAGSRAGILSSLIGIAARQSTETGQKIRIDELISFPQTWGSHG